MAPEGSPFRPLYDDRIRFSGQPIALVVAEDPEIARFAASLVRVDYEQEAHVTDLYRQRDEAVRIESSRKSGRDPVRPAKAARHGRTGLRRGRCAPRGEYYVPIEHHNPMELYASTVVWEDGGKLTVYDKTQGVQNVQRYLLQRLRHEAGRCARDVALCRRRVRFRAAPAI